MNTTINAGLRAAGFPTSSDIWLELNGQKVAVVQSYNCKATRSSYSVEAFGEEEKRVNREAAAENLQSCIDDYGIEVTYLTDEAKQAFLDKTAHIQDLIAQETGSEIMDLLDQAKAAYAG